jgi:hypothetical protein
MEFKTTLLCVGKQKLETVRKILKPREKMPVQEKAKKLVQELSGSVNSYSSNTTKVDSAHHALGSQHRSWNRHSEDTGSSRRRASTGAEVRLRRRLSLHIRFHLGNVKSFPPSERREKETKESLREIKAVGFDLFGRFSLGLR